LSKRASGLAGKIKPVEEVEKMNLVSYDPWRVFTDLHSEIDRLFDRRLPQAGDDQSDVVTSQWLPAVDIKEEAQRFLLYVDVPGVDPKDIEITMEKGVLTLKGERTAEKKEEGEHFTRQERAHGVFYRRFALPDTANPEGIEARGVNGVLEIVVPKREESQPRRIPVAA
jgi:HSP20 family protein